VTEKEKPTGIEDDDLNSESQSHPETCGSKYLAAVLLVSVARSDGNISEIETQQMLALLEEHYQMRSAESLELLTRAITDIAEKPDIASVLRDLSSTLGTDEKEDIAVMLLKVVAVDGRKDAEELQKLSVVTGILDVPADALHRAYDRYFADAELSPPENP